MLANYFKIAFRNIGRNKVYALINISGLAIGMASAILILLWVQEEMSYDRFHAQSDRLYQVYGNIKVDGVIRSGIHNPQLLGPALRKDYPEIEQTARIGWPSTVLFGQGNKNIKASGTYADPAFLTMFSFPLLKGDIHTALNDPYSVVFTESMAKKIFGEEDPMGKTVRVDNEMDFVVTGILQDLPANTQFKFEFLNSSAFIDSKGYWDKDWTNVSIRTFALLKPNTGLVAVNKKIKDIGNRYNSAAKSEYFLYPFSQTRLYGRFENGVAVGGRIETVRIFLIIAAFILFIACINFMNLSTASSEKRAKEVGIRKVSGALKASLIFQFLAESVAYATIAGVLAWVMVFLCLPAFNVLTGKQLFIDYSNPNYWLFVTGFILFTGLLAGSYPAFFLAAFKPVAVLKGTFKKVNALITPRKVLVVLQFTCAIILVIGTIVVRQQLKFGEERNTGYDKNNLIYTFMEGDLYKNYPLLEKELISSGTAVSLAKTLSPLTQVWSGGHGLQWAGKDPQADIDFARSNADGNLVKTAGLTLVQGRDLDPKNYPTDSIGCLINEAAAKAIGFKDPIGQDITDDPITWHIVGVVKDFVVESPYTPIKPMIFKGPAYSSNTINIRLNDKLPVSQALAKAEKIFKKYNPTYPFEYHFVDENYASKFNDEKLTGKLAALFASLTIFISCLGLFGLAAFMAAARIKEIGVRKVLGASVMSITSLLSRDFVKLVLIAVLLATPIAWYLATQWLEGYQYHITLSIWTFMVAAILALAIALFTISFQSIKAALMDPVKSLRNE